MARPPRSRVGGSSSNRGRRPNFNLTNPDIEWSARLVQPTKKVIEGSVQLIIVQFDAPEVLDSQTVEVLLGSQWTPMTWMDDPAHNRRAVAKLTASSLPKGRNHVWARVHMDEYMPVLKAGMFRVGGS